MPFARLKGSKRERVFNICFPKIFVLLSGAGVLVPFSKNIDNSFLTPHSSIVISPHALVWSALPKGYNRYLVEKKGFSVNECKRSRVHARGAGSD